MPKMDIFNKYLDFLKNLSSICQDVLAERDSDIKTYHVADRVTNACFYLIFEYFTNKYLPTIINNLAFFVNGQNRPFWPGLSAHYHLNRRIGSILVQDRFQAPCLNAEVGQNLIAIIHIEKLIFIIIPSIWFQLHLQKRGQRYDFGRIKSESQRQFQGRFRSPFVVELYFPVFESFYINLCIYCY